MFKRILLAISFLVPSLAMANPPSTFATCATCHGSDGIAIIDGYPNLAGQNKNYLINAINAYKKGERTGGNAAIMAPMSNLLVTDEQVEEMAEYLSTLGK